MLWISSSETGRDAGRLEPIISSKPCLVPTFLTTCPCAPPPLEDEELSEEEDDELDLGSLAVPRDLGSPARCW